HQGAVARTARLLVPVVVPLVVLVGRRCGRIRCRDVVAGRGGGVRVDRWRAGTGRSGTGGSGTGRVRGRVPSPGGVVGGGPGAGVVRLPGAGLVVVVCHGSLRSVRGWWRQAVVAIPPSTGMMAPVR